MPTRADLRSLIDLALPVVVVQLGLMIMGVVDTMMVGRVSAEALGAVALGNIFFFLVAVTGMGFTRDGRYVVEPKVIVERLSLAERRITNAIDYRGTLGPGEQQRFGPAAPAGQGSYWYAIGRDHDLERSLANRIASRAQGRVIN